MTPPPRHHVGARIGTLIGGVASNGLGASLWFFGPGLLPAFKTLTRAGKLAARFGHVFDSCAVLVLLGAAWAVAASGWCTFGSAAASLRSQSARRSDLAKHRRRARGRYDAAPQGPSRLERRHAATPPVHLQVRAESLNSMPIGRNMDLPTGRSLYQQRPRGIPKQLLPESSAGIGY